MKGRRETPLPQIRSVHAADGPHAGSRIKSADAGSTIRIAGSGFGDDPARIDVLFDGQPVPPFIVPFSDQSLTVTCPLPPAGSATIQVRAGSAASNSLAFAVTRGDPPKGRPGEATRKFLYGFDAFAALTGQFAEAIAPLTSAPAELSQTALAIEGARRNLHRSVELWLSMSPYQQGEYPDVFRAIERADEFIQRGSLVERMRDFTMLTYGPGGAIDGTLGASSKPRDSFRDSVAERLELSKDGGRSTIATGGFVLKEISKLTEAFEDILNTLAFSLEAGASAGGELGGDIEFSLGNPFSALAKLIDMVGQYLEKSASDAAQSALKEELERVRDGLARIEAKAERQEGKLDSALGVINGLVAAVTDLRQLIDDLRFVGEQLERKSDLTDGEIRFVQRLARRAIARLGTIDSKIDVMERKADSERPVIDGLVQKADQQGLKIDRLEAKGERLEVKGDAALARLAIVQTRLDLAIDKADKLERKGDSLEGKADRLERKADDIDLHIGQLGGKVDRIEGKEDRAEGKLDRLERKADQLERKHDRVEAKLDRSAEAVVHEESIADQRGVANKVTAAIVAIDAATVFLRAAVDVTRAELSDPAKWSPWISFGSPSGTIPASVSIDLQYQEGSDQLIDGVLSVRVEGGDVYQRSFQGQSHAFLVDPNAWSPWTSFGQP